jgi:1-acyl-sn-glycerol-3-phosphate acyltransferase
VVPVVQWGPHQLLPRTGAPRLWPRPRLRVVVGDPVDLSPWAGRPLDAAVLRGATAAVVDALVGLLEQVRGEPAPARWDPRTGSRLQPSG